MDYYSESKYKLDDLACFLCLAQGRDAACGAPCVPKPAEPVTIKGDLADIGLPGDVGIRRRRLPHKQRHCRPAPSAMRVLALSSIMHELVALLEVKDSSSTIALCTSCRNRWRVAPCADPVAIGGPVVPAESAAAASDSISAVSASNVVAERKQRIANAICDELKKHGIKLLGVGVSRLALAGVETWALRWLGRLPDPILLSVSDEDLALALIRLVVKFECAPDHARVALPMFSGDSAEKKKRVCELEPRLLMALPPAAPSCD